MMFQGKGKALSEAGLSHASGELGVGLPALWAVMTVETRGCGFFADRRPQILFERHVFHRRTGGRFASAAPDLSDPKAGGYGAGGVFQHERLLRAVALERRAALESTSWGLGQVMGFNAAEVGFVGVEPMVEAMCASEDAQFQAMVGFIVKNGLARYLQQGDWANFAFRYNGEDFQKNNYDSKLAKAHARFSTGPLPSLPVRATQLYLTYLGYSPGAVDGWFGENTQKALIRFQNARGLPPSGRIEDATLAELEAAAGIS
ncbi:MAG: DUF3380 domain-containing protein [Betaproteobacteria bacterium]|nr:DUF3380 domain-containing protein [Betaproteobacteria bacterium]